MVNELAIRRHFSDYMLRRMTETEIRPWYVAYYSGICENTLRQYLKGLRLPPPTTLILIAELFECSVNELLGYEPYYSVRHGRLFDPALDTDSVADYFNGQLLNMLADKNISLDEISIHVNVGVACLDSYLKNHTLPATTIILGIAEALKCTPSELLGY